MRNTPQLLQCSIQSSGVASPAEPPFAGEEGFSTAFADALAFLFVVADPAFPIVVVVPLTNTLRVLDAKIVT